MVAFVDMSLPLALHLPSFGGERILQRLKRSGRRVGDVPITVDGLL